MLKELQSFLARLRQADRSYQKEQSQSFIFRALKYLLGLLLLLFILDVILHLGPQFRLILAGAWIIAILSVAAWAYYVGRIRKNRIEKVARLLEEQEPSLGSKVINLLQLEEQEHNEDLPPRTRQLARLAVAEYKQALEKIDFSKITRLPRLALDRSRALWILGGFVFFLAVFHAISLGEVARFVDPFGDHPPYSFTQLTIVDPAKSGAKVIYNKSLIVQVKYSGHQPKELFLTCYDPAQPRQKFTLPMFSKGKAGFSQQIEGIKSDLVIFAHTRNQHSISKTRRISVVLTPKFEKAFVKVSPPAYTGLKSQENNFQFKPVRALEGSEVLFRIQSNRPLREGLIEFRRSDGQTQKIPLARTAPQAGARPGNAAVVPVAAPAGALADGSPPAKASENEVWASFSATASGRLAFTLVDIDGIASEDPLESTLTVTHDLPPEISITQPNKDCFVSIDYKAQVHIEASDDYGLKTMRIHRALNGSYSAPRVISYQGIVRSAKEVSAFDFEALGVEPGDVVSIYAEAIDTAPKANLARSQTLHLTVISEEDYNTLLRQQNDISDIQAKYSDLLNRFQDLIDQQKKIGDRVAQLQQKMANAQGKEKQNLKEEIDKLLKRQDELNHNLGKLSDEMQNIVRKNPVYDAESELKDMLSKKAEAIRQSTQENERQMRDLAKQPPSQQTLQAIKKASDDQLKKLGAAEQEARKNINDTFQDLSQMQELLKDFNQFEQLFETQQTLAEQTQAYNSNATLKREDQIALRDMASTEKNVEDDLRGLANKLRGDSKAAEQKFPKAAQGAKDLAAAIEKQRLPALAKDATDSMLNAQGEQSHQQAERLRAEMEKLFGDCQSQGEAQRDELDQYLKLQRGMNPGETFQQMMQSRKFGGASGQARGQGENGQGGNSGYSVNSSQDYQVLGNETRISSGETRKSSSDNVNAQKPGGPTQNGDLRLDKPDAPASVNAVNRKSDAVTSESPLDQYDGLVEKYFKSITK